MPEHSTPCVVLCDYLLVINANISHRFVLADRDCNPGIPGFPNHGIPEIFQSRNPGISGLTKFIYLTVFSTF